MVNTSQQNDNIDGLKQITIKILIMKKKMWYDFQLKNSPQETNMTQKLTTIGHRTAFNNEKSPYSIVSYKRPRNDNVKQFKRKKLTGLIMLKK